MCDFKTFENMSSKPLLMADSDSTTAPMYLHEVLAILSHMGYLVVGANTIPRVDEGGKGTKFELIWTMQRKW